MWDLQMISPFLPRYKIMTKEDWEKIKWFTPDENWGDPDKMSPHLIFYLDKLRTFIGHKIIIHYENHKPDRVKYIIYIQFSMQSL